MIINIVYITYIAQRDIEGQGVMSNTRGQEDNSGSRWMGQVTREQDN